MPVALVGNHWQGMCGCFLCSLFCPLVHLLVCVPALGCVNPCGFVLNLKCGRVGLRMVLLLRTALAIWGFQFLMNATIVVPISLKNATRILIQIVLNP